MITWYVAIKLAEWCIWSSIGLFFLFQAYRAKGRSRWLGFSLAAAFFVFGGADFIEYFTNGTFPWWLWTWKIMGGLALFTLLVARDYVNRGPVALAPWRFMAAAAILSLTLYCASKS